MAEKTYVATEKLFVGTAPAHNVGDEVPAENVEPNGWKDSVVLVAPRPRPRLRRPPREQRAGRTVSRPSAVDEEVAYAESMTPEQVALAYGVR